MEETSFRPRLFWVVPYVNVFYDQNYDSINLNPLFAAQVDHGENPILSVEHDEFGWFLFEEALSKLALPGQRKGLCIVQDYIVKGEKASKFCRVLDVDTKL